MFVHLITDYTYFARQLFEHDNVRHLIKQFKRGNRCPNTLTYIYNVHYRWYAFEWNSFIWMWYRIGTRVWALERNKTDGWNWHVLIDIMKFKCNCLNGRRQNAESYYTSNSILNAKLQSSFTMFFVRRKANLSSNWIAHFNFIAQKKTNTAIIKVNRLLYYIVLVGLAVPCSYQNDSNQDFDRRI